LVTLDDFVAIATNVLIPFVVAIFGVIIGLMITFNHERVKKNDETRETQIRILSVIRSELETNLVALKETTKKGSDFGLIPVFLTDSYESSISNGDFSLLEPNTQNLLALVYLNFKQWDKLGDRAIAMYGSRVGDPEKLANMFVEQIQKKTSAILNDIPKAIMRIDEGLKRLQPNWAKKKPSPGQRTP
jgi:hypothetical protein